MRHLIGGALVLLSMAWSPALRTQGGQGANAIAGDAMSLLRSGPLTRTPTESYEIRFDLPAFPAKLIPEDAKVVVASVSPSLTVVVATIKAAPLDQIRFGWKLEEQGWVNVAPGRMGFVGAPMVAPPLTFCKGGDFATFTFRSTANGESMIRAAVGQEPMRACAPMGMRNFSDVPIPPLEAPPGARMTTGGGGGGMDDMYSRTRFETTMTVAALAAHFTAQIASAGWKIDGAPVGDEMMSVTRFVTVSKNGDPVTALLILTKLGDTPFVDGMLRVVRQKPVR